MNMRLHKRVKLRGIWVIALTGVVVCLSACGRQDNSTISEEIKPIRGTIESFISTTGTVLPKNRLEIKPPVNGRIEEIMVREGERVQAGQTLALMSSTERAAMLDAARGQGPEKVKYWEEVYKPITLISPAAGEVIVAKTQPGQTVTVNDPIVVLSDKLIVRAQVDETDIGRIKTGTAAVIKLDAYPDAKIKGIVEHIYYESQTVNNVTMYEVDLVPENMPDFFRSGMNATIDLTDQVKNDVMLLPGEVIQRDKDTTWVYVKEPGKSVLVKRVITIGITGDKEVEVASGVSENDTVVSRGKKYALPQKDTGENPFMPSRRKR